MPYWMMPFAVIWIGGLFYLIVRVWSRWVQLLNELAPGRSIFDGEGGGFFDPSRYSGTGQETHRRMITLWWITIGWAAGGMTFLLMLASLARMYPQPLH